MDSIIRKHSAKKQKKNYFTKETEQAIVRYNNEKNFETRSNIYQKEIHYPFFKLTQNIIHTFKFYHTEVENLGLFLFWYYCKTMVNCLYN